MLDVANVTKKCTVIFTLKHGSMTNTKWSHKNIKAALKLLPCAIRGHYIMNSMSKIIYNIASALSNDLIKLPDAL